MTKTNTQVAEVGSADQALMDNPLGTAPIPKLLLQYAPPAILSMMVVALYNLIDTFFVGHAVGQDGIAATTVAFPVMMLMGAFAMWFGAGGNARAALKLGGGKFEEAERTLGNSLFLLILVPVVLTIVALVFIEPLLDLLGATDANRQLSRDFCHVILVGFVFQGISSGLSNFIRTDGAPTYALIVMFVGAASSALFNYLLVMLLGMGMTGSALATVLGQLISTVLVLQYFLSKRCKMRLRLHNMRPDLSLISSIAALGLSTFAVQVAASFTTSMLNVQISNLGPTDPIGADGGLAVIGTAQKIIQVLFFVVMGFSVAAQPILGYNYGAHQYRRVTKTLWTTIAAGVVTNLVLWSLCRVFCSQIMSFFSLSTDLHDFAAMAFYYMTFMFPVVPLQVIGSNYFMATGQPLKATFLTLTRQLIFYLPALFLVPTFLPNITGMTPLAALTAAPSFADALAILVTGVFMVLEAKRIKGLERAQEERRRQPAGARDEAVGR